MWQNLCSDPVAGSRCSCAPGALPGWPWQGRWTTAAAASVYVHPCRAVGQGQCCVTRVFSFFTWAVFCLWSHLCSTSVFRILCECTHMHSCMHAHACMQSHTHTVTYTGTHTHAHTNTHTYTAETRFMVILHLLHKTGSHHTCCADVMLQAQELCQSCGQAWRAATLEGWRLFHDVNWQRLHATLTPITGNPHRDVWKCVCWRMASEVGAHCCVAAVVVMGLFRRVHLWLYSLYAYVLWVCLCVGGWVGGNASTQMPSWVYVCLHTCWHMYMQWMCMFTLVCQSMIQ